MVGTPGGRTSSSPALNTTPTILPKKIEDVREAGATAVAGPYATDGLYLARCCERRQRCGDGCWQGNVEAGEAALHVRPVTAFGSCDWRGLADAALSF
jgi:hypothetical protein